MVSVRCRYCGTRFRLRPEDAGKKGRCPNEECRQEFRAPSSVTEKSPPSGSSSKGQKKSVATQTSSSTRGSSQRGKTDSAKKRRSRKKGRSQVNYPVWGASTGGILLLLVALVFWIRSGDDPTSTGQTVVAAEQLNPIAQLDFKEDITPLFQKYCTNCHSNDYHEGDFSFERYASAESLKGDREIWKKVLHLVRLGAMPPAAESQPTPEERAKLSDWIDYQLFFVDCSVPFQPGRVTARRLNRNEYNNTVRDLLNVDFQPAKDFPSDDVGYGFDNIGDVLSVPPLLIEKYLTAAEQVAEKAVPVQHPQFFKKRVAGKELKGEGAVHPQGNGSKAIVSRGKVFNQYKFPEGGTYVLRIDAMADQAGDELAKMEIRLDDKVVKTFEINGHKKKNDIVYEIEVAAGQHTLSAGFINDFYDEKAKERKDRNLYVDFLEVEGPLGLPKSVRENHPLLRVYPEDGITVAHAAQTNLREFLPRAFRRAVSEDEVKKYVGLVEMAFERGQPFESAIRVAVQAILVSPHFLFRLEDARQKLGSRVQLDDYALASRLSYFLWSSLPDEELFQLAKENRLHEPSILQAQTERMLNDPKVEALIANFAGQWLGLRKLTTNEVAPNPELFPDFDEKLRRDMWKETELFFGSIVKEDRSLYDLLDGPYSYLNERLARLYGIEGITGEDFRRVDFQNGQRQGVLTHASILTLTSYPDRTSPVKRGQWVLENLLNDAPPDPPPTAPSLEETQAKNPNLSFREQLELHRKDPGCAACHVTMDEIGFGLENFDAIGRWRTTDGQFEVNPTGTLPNGQSFSGPSEMISVLKSRKAQFGKCLTEKLMIFAIGRGLEYYDRCAIETVMLQLQQDDRFSVLVSGIVQSAPFQLRSESE